jgi:MFS family permease
VADGARRSGRKRGSRSLVSRVAVDTRPLRYAPYRRMWIGNGVSFVGFQVTAVAVPVQMDAITHSPAWNGWLGLAGLVPLVVFAIWGGAVSDVFDRRRLNLISSFFTWTVTLILLGQALLGVRSPALLLLLTGLQAIGFALVAPTRGAIVPRLVPADLVPAANTLNFTVSSVATVAGPLLAGVVLGTGHYAAAYAVDAVLFTMSLWASFRLPPLPPLGDRATRPNLRAVVSGLAFIAATPLLWLSFSADLIANVLAMPRALFPAVARLQFNGAGSAGWLYSAIAIGGVVGGLFSGWIGRVRRQGVALVGAVACWGLAVAAAGLARSLWLAVLLLAVAGCADLVSSVYRQTILQLHAPDEMRGRLQGVFTAVVAGGPRLGDVRAGLTASVFNPTASWVSGGLAATFVIILLGLVFPALRRYDAHPPDRPARQAGSRA